MPERGAGSGEHGATDFRHAAPPLLVVSLGLRPYTEVWALQKEIARARIAGELAEDVLLLVEHPPVVTMGRSSKEAHLVASRELLAARGVELYEVERGGDVTFHGPGQLVGYPILDLRRHRKDLHWYLRQVEEALIRGIAAFGLAGERNAGYTGVWIGESGERHCDVSPRPAPRKLASIGVHARDWVTWHGFALNVATDLAYFDLIVPCGIHAVAMTSLARELAPHPVAMPDVERAVAAAFGEVFAREPVDATLAELLTPRSALPALPR